MIGRFRKVNKKLNTSGGFTLAETLVTILIMTIVLSAITGGMMVARNAYRELSRKADAQTLLATSVSVITEDLSGASDFETAPSDCVDYSFKTTARGYRIAYRNAGSGSTDGSGNTSGEKGIYVQPMLTGTDVNTSIETPLVTQKTSTLDLYTKIEIKDAAADGEKPCSVVKVTVNVYSTLLSTGDDDPVEKGVVYIRTAEG